MNESRSTAPKLDCFLPCSGDCSHVCKTWQRLSSAIKVVRNHIDIIDHIELFKALGIDERIIRFANAQARKDLTEYRYDLSRNNSVGIEYVDTMSGEEFELFIKRLYSKIGFNNITLTQRSHDGGFDASALKKKQPYIFQCKRLKSNVGVRSIREFIGVTKSNKNKTKGIFIATSDYTMAARKFAKKSRDIQLINRRELTKLIAKFLVDDIPGFEIKSGVTSWRTDRVSTEFYLTNTSKQTMTNISGVLCFYDVKGLLTKEIIPKVACDPGVSLKTGEKRKFEFVMSPVDVPYDYARVKFAFDRNYNKKTYRITESSKIYIG